jgi:NADH-quinone oxidoreductase subunit C
MSVTPQGSPPARSAPDGEIATTDAGSTSSDVERAGEQASAVTSARPASPPAAGSDLFGSTLGSDTSGFGGLVRQAPSGQSTPRPYGGWFDEAVDALQESLPGLSDIVTRTVVDRGELTLHVRRERVAELCRHLRDDPDQRYELLLGVSGVDFPDQPERLHVVYHLMSMTYRRRLRLETACGVADPHVASVCEVYPTADFHERETWDMFGVMFDGHPNLTRILMPDDWDGHPQRKDYPLGGVPVEYKGAQIPPPDERRSYA